MVAHAPNPPSHTASRLEATAFALQVAALSSRSHGEYSEQ
jgi:hypothetical protein